MMKPSRPLCLICRKRARFLNDKYGKDARIFCSLKCATKYAMSACAMMRWCGKHQNWYNIEYGCNKCTSEDVSMANENGGIKVTLNREADSLNPRKNPWHS